MIALITKRNSPNVISVMGIVNRMSIGFMITLAMDNNKAVSKAVW
jgi:hypothetical protein